MPLLNEIAGSSVRDFCMLERNYLSHFKLVLLLLLLSCSALLNTRLPAPGSEGGHHGKQKADFPISTLQIIAAVLTIIAAVWEYHRGVRDLLKVRAFLVGTKVHYSLMTAVSAIVVVTCFVYIASG